VAFLLMGFSFSVTQALMIRELLVAFSGNELSIGLVLGSWLILEAIGSGLLGRLAERIRATTPSYALLQGLLAFLLPVSLYVAITIRTFMGLIPGEGVGLVPIFVSSFLLLLPLGLVDGAMFTFGCRIYSRLIEEKAPAVGRVYVYEAIGGIVGGVAFTYLFIPYLRSIQMVLVLGLLNLVSAFSLILLHGVRRPWLVPYSLLLALTMGLLWRSEAVHRWLVSRQWQGYNLVFYQNSIYGNVSVIQEEEQYTFFADGIPIFSAPVPDIALVEEMVHLPLLFVERPRRALVVSGGVGGILWEILKYPVEAVDYAELDPLLIEAVQRFPTPLTVKELADPRVRVHNVDGRLLVKKKAWELTAHPSWKYDLIVLNLPYPSTLQLNRFYTVEFFRSVRAIMTPGGVVVVPLPGTTTYMSSQMRDLHAALYRTLREVFPHVRPIPGETTLWLASPSEEVEAMPLEALLRRWEERQLPVRLMSDFHIRLKLDAVRLSWFWDSLKTGEEVKLNRDLHPTGLLYGLAYWNELFSPGFSPYFEGLRRLSLPFLGAPVLAGTLLAWVVVRRERFLREFPVSLAIAATGFGGMAFDLIVIFAFQAFYGYVYHVIGLLITAFMAGLSLGGWAMSRRLGRLKGGWALLMRLEGALVVSWLLFPLALTLLYAQAHRPWLSTWMGVILLGLNVLGGFLVGLEFPLANHILLGLGEEVTGAAGLLYAADLVGAFSGAVAVSAALLPSLGLPQTCLLIALMKLGSLFLISTTSSA